MKRLLVALLAIGVALGLFYSRRTPKNPDALSFTEENASEPKAEIPPALAGVKLVPIPAAPPVKTDDAFSAQVKKAEEALPTDAKLQALKPEEFHSMPPPVREASIEIAKLADDIEKDPSLAPKGIEFYTSCAKREDIAASTRATCLANLRDLSKKTGASLDESGVSADVRKLTDQIMK